MKKKLVSILLIAALFFQMIPSMAFASATASETQELQNLRRVVLQKGYSHDGGKLLETDYQEVGSGIQAWQGKNQLEFITMSHFRAGRGAEIFIKMSFVYDLNTNQVRNGRIVGEHYYFEKNHYNDKEEHVYARFNPRTYRCDDVLTYYDQRTNQRAPQKLGNIFNTQLSLALSMWNNVCKENAGISLGDVGFAAFAPTKPAKPSQPNHPIKPVDNGIQMFIDSKTMYIDGQKTTTDVPPVIIQSRTMVPIRFVAENLGCAVDWNAATKNITITQNGKVLNMTVGKEIPGFGAAPVIRNARTLVPIRYVSEALGANVDYDPAQRSVIITK